MSLSQPTIKIKASLDATSMAQVRNKVLGEIRQIESKSKIKVKLEVDKSALQVDKDKVSSKIKVDTSQVKNAKTEVSKLKSELNNVTNKKITPKVDTSQLATADGVIHRLSNSLKDVFKLGLLKTAFSTFASAVNVAKDAIMNFDRALTEYNKVTKLSQDEMKGQLKVLQDYGQQVGRTTSEMIEGTTGWKKAGFSDKDASILSKVTALYQNTADEVMTTSQATDILTSILKAYNIEAKDSIQITDKINKVSADFAVSSGDIGQGLKVASASMSTMGNSIDQTTALLTAGTTIFQHQSSQVARGLNTIGLGLTKNASKLQQYGISTTDANGKLRSTYDILKDLHSVWDSLGETQERADLGMTIAGKNQYKILSAIMQQWDTAEKALNESMNASGETMKQNEVFMDSLQAKINTLKSAFENLVLSGGLGSLAKVFIDATSGALNLINTIGGLPTILMGVASALTIIKSQQIASGIATVINGIKGGIGAIKNFGTSLKNIVQSVKGISDLKAIGSTLFDSFRSGSDAIRNQAQASLQATGALKGLSEAEKEVKIQQEATNIAMGNAISVIGGVMAVVTVAMSVYQAYTRAKEEQARKEEESFQESINEMEKLQSAQKVIKDETSSRQDLIQAINNTDLANKGELQSISDTTEMRKKATKAIQDQTKANYELNKSQINKKIKGIDKNSKVGDLFGFSEEHGYSSILGAQADVSGKSKVEKNISKYSKELESAKDIYAQQKAISKLIPEINKYRKSAKMSKDTAKEWDEAQNKLTEAFKDNDKKLQKATETGNKYKKFLDKDQKDALKRANDTRKQTNDLLSGETKKQKAKKKTADTETALEKRNKQIASDSKKSLDELSKKYAKTYNVSQKSLKENMANIKAIADKYGMTISEAMEMLGYATDKANDSVSDVYDNFQKLEQSFQSAVSDVGNLANGYTTLSNACEEYNEQGYLNLDTLQNLLSQSPEYLSCLDFEGDKLTINEEKYRQVAESKINNAEAEAYLEAQAVLTGKAIDDESQSANNSVSAHESAKSGMQVAETEMQNLISIVNQGTQAWNEYAKAASQGAVSNGVSKDTADKALDTLHTRLTMLESAKKNLGNITKHMKANTKATRSNSKAVGGNGKARKGGSGKTKDHTGATKKNTDAVKKNTDALKNRQKVLQDEVQKYETVIEYIKGKVSDYIDELEKQKDKETEVIQNQIDQLNEQAQARDDYYTSEIDKLQELSQADEDYYNQKIDEINAINDKLDDEIQLQQLLDNLEKAKKTKVKVYHEGQGFVYDVDQSAVSEAQKELDEYKRKKESEQRIKALEQERDKKKAVYDQEIKDLESKQKAEKENFDLQTKQLEQHKKDIEKHYDDIINYWKNWNEQFQKQVDAYKDHQNALLAEQLTGINFENNNWTTRLNNLGNFVNNYRAKCAELEEVTRRLNQATQEYERAQARASQSSGYSPSGGGGGGSAGGGGGGSAPHVNMSHVANRVTNAAISAISSMFTSSPIGHVYTWHGGTPYQRKEKGKWKNYTTADGNHGFKVTSQDGTYYYGTSHRGNYIRVKKSLAIATNRTNAYASGTPSVKEDEVAFVGDTPNTELVVGSKLNGTPINLQKGSGVVNAKSTKTLSGLLNGLADISSNNAISNLTNNNNNQNIVIENVTIDGHNISDVNSFVNELQNIKGIALQRAYRK